MTLFCCCCWPSQEAAPFHPFSSANVRRDDDSPRAITGSDSDVSNALAAPSLSATGGLAGVTSSMDSGRGHGVALASSGVAASILSRGARLLGIPLDLPTGAETTSQTASLLPDTITRSDQGLDRFRAPPPPPPFETNTRVGSSGGDEGGSVQESSAFPKPAPRDIPSGRSRAGGNLRGSQFLRVGGAEGGAGGLLSSKREGGKGEGGNDGTDDKHPNASTFPPRRTASMKSMGEEDCCPTCLDGYDSSNPRIETKCGHHYHLACIYEWMERSNRCPVCDKVMAFSETL